MRNLAKQILQISLFTGREQAVSPQEPCRTFGNESCIFQVTTRILRNLESNLLTCPGEVWLSLGLLSSPLSWNRGESFCCGERRSCIRDSTE